MVDFVSYTTQRMLIYKYFGICAIVLNVRYLGILPNVFFSLPLCSLTMKTLVWNKK